MRRLLLLIVLVVFYCNKVFASNYVYVYDANCSNAYKNYLALHMAAGNAWLFQAVKSNPANLMATYIADYSDCLTLLFNGDKNVYNQCKSHIDERLNLLDKGDENSPWYRFCKAGIYLHWALVYVRFGETFKAATTFRKSYLLTKENAQLFPDFEYNNVYLGLEQTATGAIPDNYKWIASVFGMKGNIRKGVSTLSNFINKHTYNDPLREEAVVFYIYLKFYLLSQQQEVWNFLNTNIDTHDNLLFTFVKANIAINYRKADVALETLNEGEKDKQYSNYPIFDFEMGSALSLKLQSSCIGYFQRFLKDYHGGLFIKDTWQKMALQYYLDRNMTQANYCMQQIQKQGSKQVDADKQAQRFSEEGVWPNTVLLQARLLIDGGYYKQALDKLNQVSANSFNNIVDKLEYYFRMGRVYDELGYDEKALQYYQETINLGKEREEYFAARSALQMAFIYEHTGKNKEALKRYNEALNMHDHDFQASIDQQAKAGINRLSVR